MIKYRALAVLLSTVGLISCSSAPVSRRIADSPIQDTAWIELGPSSQIIARLITGANDCPKITLDSSVLPMSVRAVPSDAFPVLTCEAVVPPGTQSARIADQSLPLPTAQPKRILFFGDSGCRILVKKKGTSFIQACNDPKAWPFPHMARTEAKMNPDLVVHLGDYLYRENPCPKHDSACSGSPSGNNWETWNADFFDAARPLLKVAPWIFVRGNHELCSRAGEGWFRFLDPRRASGCSDVTDPYLVQQGSAQFVVLDSALAMDPTAPEDQVKLYKAQLDAIAAMPLKHAWLVTHKPFGARISLTSIKRRPRSTRPFRRHQKTTYLRELI